MSAPKNSLQIRGRFIVVIVISMLAILAVLSAALVVLHSSRNHAAALYRDHFLATQSISSLEAALQSADRVSLNLALATNPTNQQQLTTQLLTEVSPAVQSSLQQVSTLAGEDAAAQTAVSTITTQWVRFQTLLASGSLTTADTRSAGVAQVGAAFTSAIAAATAIQQTESAKAVAANRATNDDYVSSVEVLLIDGLVALLLSLGIVLWLRRSVLPRVLLVSTFAEEVSHGGYWRRLRPRGDDELAELGRLLDEVAENRQTDDVHDRDQLELLDALAFSQGEQEANELLKRHLERSVAGKSVTILNSDDDSGRLEAVTPVDPKSALARGLRSAKPRSCLAIRKSQQHSSVSGQDALLECTVCSSCPGLTTCTPLVVSGEVIGSVLAVHELPMSESDERTIRDAIVQVAPVIGNMRSRDTSAQLRAALSNRDGLPDAHVSGETIRRMIAQTTRTMAPLAAVRWEIDQFEQLCTRYGPGRGDEILAAVGAALSTSVRISDFVGCYGSNGFIVLLPDTDSTVTRPLVEKIHAVISTIEVAGLDQVITTSAAIAVFPEHVLGSDSLESALDLSLGRARAAGGNRIEVFTEPASAAAAPRSARTAPLNGTGKSAVRSPA